MTIWRIIDLDHPTTFAEQLFQCSSKLIAFEAINHGVDAHITQYQYHYNMMEIALKVIIIAPVEVKVHNCIGCPENNETDYADHERHTFTSARLARNLLQLQLDHNSDDGVRSWDDNKDPRT